ncbi:MAG TPA: signal recognition particle-docking protein FtsY [Candidatus Binataceae bacterium]|nr:signal recognition particle-docking protein FtsY [Candidatus Binataceae bacterium]
MVRLALEAAALQAVLLIVATLIEFSARKRRRVASPERAAVPAAAPVTAPEKAAPVAAPAEEAAPPLAAPPPARERPKFEETEARAARAPTPPSRVEAPPPAAGPPSAAERSEAATAETAAAPCAPPFPPPGEKAPARIGLGLRRTRENLLARIRAAISGSARLDEICEGLEEALIAADVGVNASLKLVEAVRARVKDGSRSGAIRDALKDEIARMLAATERPMNVPAEGPFVIMLAGVNGVGKTTTVAKLAARMKAERGAVIVAAADTFRAAAIEQLEVWCGRVGVDLIKQKQGSDPAAVAFDAVKAAVARDTSTVIIDTAGRLQTKVNLMEELKKISRVVGRELAGAPHECWLVLDATTGQNALSQAKLFGEAVPLTGVILAKLDSTAKGGVVVAIAEQLKLPVRFVGLGENIEDLRAFDPREFVEALFAEDEARAEAPSGSYAA